VRKLVIALVISGSLAACGSPSTQRATTTTPLAPCTARQVTGQLRGIQGAAGNWSASIWIADKSSKTCALQSPVDVGLLNSSGTAQLHATASFAALPLTANTAFPPSMRNPSPEQKLAGFDLFWPTDALVAASMGATSGMCPVPDFVPTTLRLVFGNGAAIEVSNETTGPTSMARIEVCGSQITISAASGV